MIFLICHTLPTTWIDYNTVWVLQSFFLFAVKTNHILWQGCDVLVEGCCPSFRDIVIEVPWPEELSRAYYYITLVQPSKDQKLYRGYLFIILLLFYKTTVVKLVWNSL